VGREGFRAVFYSNISRLPQLYTYLSEGERKGKGIGDIAVGAHIYLPLIGG